ncbi:olfactory receptor 5F1-like [Ambystoma mexicanum]|uniref:olfactory receptor 5F1-like n=1 Tax=Ambystoma mexicanum TaxID=8296 RepID=UPI0037E842BA
MVSQNLTKVTECILLGLSDLPELQTTLFILFLAFYMVGLLGNGTIIAVITADSQLHTPMYFFIRNMSFVDLCLITVIVPKLLININSERKTITFAQCMTQLFFFVLFAGMESILLGVMAYDRYVAICNPLRYIVLMSRRTCFLLTCGCWMTGLLNSMLHSVTISLLSFCSANQIQQFFCDIPPLLKVSCSDTSTNELLLLVEAASIAMVCILSVVVSYVHIIASIIKIHSSEGRRKAFSTCSSHLITVSLYYGTILFTYIRPTSSYSLEKDKVVTVMYTVVTPMLNPFIYSLRNKQVKRALTKVLEVKKSMHVGTRLMLKKHYRMIKQKQSESIRSFRKAVDEIPLDDAKSAEETSECSARRSPVALPDVSGEDAKRALQRRQDLSSSVCYRRFISGFTSIVSPLTALTSPNVPFLWSDTQQKAFDSLKTAFTTAPVLQHPDSELPFIVEADASSFALGAVLSQACQATGRLHPVAFHSRKFTTPESHYTVTEMELLAFTDAFRVWRHHLLGAKHRVTVFTDHQNLQDLASLKCLNSRQTPNVHVSGFVSHEHALFWVDQRRNNVRDNHNAGLMEIQRQSTGFPTVREEIK